MRPLDLWFSTKHFEPDWFAKGPRKYLADGAFSSHSAWLSEPYADRPQDAGLLGQERARRAYPFRSLLDAGIRLAFGSDYPGERTFDPLYGIHLAANRGGGQAISAYEALCAYTAGGAWAEFREDDEGMLKPGYLCDIAVLSGDPIEVDPARIHEIDVDATVVDGTIVYERPGRELRRRDASGQSE